MLQSLRSCYGNGAVLRKKSFENQFFKSSLKTNSDQVFFSIFENPIKFPSLTRNIRKDYRVELYLFIYFVKNCKKLNKISTG